MSRFKKAVLLNIAILMLIAGAAWATYFYALRCKSLQVDGTTDTDVLKVHNTFRFIDLSAAPRLSLKSDFPLATTTGTDLLTGSTVEFGASVFDVGESLEITCYVQLTGNADTKDVSLYFGDTQNALVTIPASATGVQKVHFIAIEYLTTEQQAGVGDAILSGSTVTSVLTTPATTAVDMTDAKEISVRAQCASGSDSLVVYACFWEYWPKQ